VLFHNILADLTIFRLKHQSASATQNRITSLSFCLDPSVGAGEGGGTKDLVGGSGRIMVASDSEGDVTIWDLSKRRVTGVLRNAHFGAISKAEFMPGQNLMITAGVDNSIKEWVFDSPHSPLPRLLKMRGGHSQPPTTLTFWKPEESHFLLSSSLDQSLWGVSLRNDAQNFELSQGAGTNAMANSREDILAKKAGPITALAAAPETGMQRDWENVVTAHRGERAARTWTFKNKRIGRWTFETADKSEVKSVAISACGNFALIGSSLGGIEMFNLQSGKKRREFPQPRQVGKKLFKMPGGHTKAVTSILTDETNKVVISTGLDGKVKFWNFGKGTFTAELDWSSTCGITTAKLYNPSDLLACACDDLGIRIVDTVTRKIVRELWGSNGRITDLTFSNDGRWIIAASLDSILRIWDLPTGHLVERIQTPSIITALAFSGTGEFLATAHVGDVGVNLWTNKTLFSRTPTKAIPDEETVVLSNPTTSGEGGTGIIDVATDAVDIEEVDEDDMAVYRGVEQINKDLQTLSLLPQNRWQTLVHLDLIKERNKPKEAPKAPEKAPFFLPSLSGAANPNASNLLPSPAEASGPSTAGTHSALLAQSSAMSQSKFTQLIHTDAHKFIDHLLTLAPSATSVEIRSLDPNNGETALFVRAVTKRMKERKDWEVCQAWIRMFLKAWGEDVATGVEEGDEEWKGFDEEEDEDGDGDKGDWREEARLALREWKEVQEMESERLDGLGGWASGVGAFLRGF
jgi:U3 small nucleolar RNA-associated protein 21